MNAVLDCPDFAELIEGMARDLALVQPDGRETWLRDFRRGVGSDMTSEVVDELVARIKARVAELGTCAAPTVH
jgi:hypothetical protein